MAWNMDTHLRHCSRSKRSLSDLLSQTKDFWESRKRRRLENGNVANTGLANSTNIELEGPREVPTSLIASPDISPDDPSIHVSIAARKPARVIRPPIRYRQDDSPDPPIAIEASVSGGNIELSDVNAGTSEQVTVPQGHSVFASNRDKFGVLRTYRVAAGTADPTHGPSCQATRAQSPIRAQSPTRTSPSPAPSPAPQKDGNEDAPVTSRLYGPFPNKSSFSLADWYWGTANKSFADFQKLVNILKQPDFAVGDVANVRWTPIFRTLGANKEALSADEGAWITDGGWKTAPIYIDIPFHKQMKMNKGTIESHLVGCLRYRSIVSVIREALADPTTVRRFHYYPHSATWKPSGTQPEIKLFGELYMTPQFQAAYDEVQQLPPTPQNRGLERIVVALMFSSDGTTLTEFSTAKLWPTYMSFGNESKYDRCKPSDRSNYHIAYLESISDSFMDRLRERNGGKLPTEALLKHAHCEVFQKQWSVLLEGELMEAMKDGIVIKCLDGTPRCFYPRPMTYSADYQEKCLVASVRRNGTYPCHRCLVSNTKENMRKLGAPNDVERTEKCRDEHAQNAKIDSARESIFIDSYAVDGDAVENKLAPESLVPTKNAFSILLEPFNFSIASALVVDLLHEFEIGVWKKIFIHLIRLLEAVQNRTSPVTLTAELDQRYRATPIFGWDGIRKFSSNASKMKRKAARDYEDLLQCAIPAFDSLLPEAHNLQLTKLLYICAQWHALAKLRQHNDLTIELLEYTTTLLGAQIRTFDKFVCCDYETLELKKEAEARLRRQGKGKPGNGGRRKCPFNVYTIKLHFLGDYAATIRQFGTTDSFSTEIGELSHCLPKSWYPRTNKRDYIGQMAQIERRQARLAQIRSDTTVDVEIQELDESLNNSSPEATYIIGANQNNFIDFSYLYPRHGVQQTIYLSEFIPKLRRHFLPRIIQKLGFKMGDVDLSQWASVCLQDDRLYLHKTLRFEYTTYDIQKARDIVHLKTHQRNVMLLNPAYTKDTQDTEHPYAYFHVLAIHHANVCFIGTLPNGSRSYNKHRLDVVWARRYDWVAPEHPFQLDRLKLRSLDKMDTLTFIDPSQILRAVHLIPQFQCGPLDEKKAPSWTRGSPRLDDELWDCYYVNRFCDRDMFMRYQWGMSVGHRYMHTNFRAPRVPTLEPDFDHCLDLDLTDEPDDELIEDAPESETSDDKSQSEDSDEGPGDE